MATDIRNNFLETYPPYIRRVEAAYSLRKVNVAYKGPIVTIRRSSDNSTRNIGIYDKELDIKTLSEFCEDSEGYVCRWYDQGGKNRDLVQFSFSMQPLLYKDNSVILRGGKPSIYFDGLDDYLYTIGKDLLIKDNLNISGILDFDYWSENSTYLSIIPINSDSDPYLDISLGDKIDRLKIKSYYRVRLAKTDQHITQFREDEIKYSNNRLFIQISRTPSRMSVHIDKELKSDMSYVYRFYDAQGLQLGRPYKGSPISLCEQYHQEWVICNESPLDDILSSKLSAYYNIVSK